MMSESVTSIAPALLKARDAFKPAVKDSSNPHFKSKFVSLAGVYSSIDEALMANGIIPIQPTRISDDGRTVLVTTLLHKSGEWIAGEYPVQALQPGPQGEGSALTYARRYALLAICGLAPEDDDGNDGSQPPPQRQRPVTPPADGAVLRALKAATDSLDADQTANVMRDWREAGLPRLELLSPVQAELAMTFVQAAREPHDLTEEELPL